MYIKYVGSLLFPGAPLPRSVKSLLFEIPDSVLYLPAPRVLNAGYGFTMNLPSGLPLPVCPRFGFLRSGSYSSR